MNEVKDTDPVVLYNLCKNWIYTVIIGIGKT